MPLGVMLQKLEKSQWTPYKIFRQTFQYRGPAKHLEYIALPAIAHFASTTRKAATVGASLGAEHPRAPERHRHGYLPRVRATEVSPPIGAVRERGASSWPKANLQRALAPNEVWTEDTTKIHGVLPSTFYVVHPVIDLFSRTHRA